MVDGIVKAIIKKCVNWSKGAKSIDLANSELCILFCLQKSGNREGLERHFPNNCQCSWDWIKKGSDVIKRGDVNYVNLYKKIMI
jgi:hypothetical protein